MTGGEFRKWRRRCGLTAPEAAKALGVSRRTIFYLQTRVRIPGPFILATAAVESKINCEREAS